MPVTTNDIRNWLLRHYHDHDIEPNPVHGTYGLIWFLRAKSASVRPASFAVKTVAPEKLTNSSSLKEVEYLRREFRIWLSLPPTYNVLPALGFDLARLSGESDQPIVTLPVMRMPRMSGSLQDWVGSSTAPSVENRLVALAQAFNGLLSLYENGIEGHGDLKLQNILYEDLRLKFELANDGGWPSKQNPWRIVIADLGWADAWVDLGFSNKALRQYLAPERLDGQVVPAQSDVFAMGVVAAELLQGCHPAANLQKALKSEGNWRRWVATGERDLTGIASDRVRNLIIRCLNSEPYRRPTPQDCLFEICAEIKSTYGHSVAATLEFWRRPVGEGLAKFAGDEHRGWAAGKSIGLGSEQARCSIGDLEARINEVKVCDLATCERWLALAEGLAALLDHEGANEVQKLWRLREEATNLLRSFLGPMVRDSLIAIGAHEGGIKLITPFERFSVALMRMNSIAETAFECATNGSFGLSPFASCALAFAFASKVRIDNDDPQTVEFYLAEAIRFAPEEAVPYYFRARWRYDLLIVALAVGSPAIVAGEESLVADLHKASNCDSDWQEPRDLLRLIRAKVTQAI